MAVEMVIVWIERVQLQKAEAEKTVEGMRRQKCGGASWRGAAAALRH